MSNAAGITGHVPLTGGTRKASNVHLSKKAWRRIEMRSSPMWVQVYPQPPNYSNPENSRRRDQDLLLPQHSGGDKRILVCSSAFDGTPGETTAKA